MTINPMLDMLLMLATGKVQNAAKVQTYTPGSIERACRNPEEAEGEARIKRAMRPYYQPGRLGPEVQTDLCPICRDPKCFGLWHSRIS